MLSAERRMGKTSVIKKMTVEPIDGVIPVFRDLEAVRTPLEFVQNVYDDVDRYLTMWSRTTHRVRAFLSQVAEIQVAGAIKFPAMVAEHWKTILAHTIADLMEHQDKTLVFFWDELPLMLYNIKNDLTDGERVAAEMLDALRALRQTYPQVRFVYTGSIGLHHVLTGLRHGGYANDPTNDMYALDVPPLKSADAAFLARNLLAGENIKVSDENAVAASIAHEADDIPFFIHHIVRQLRLEGVRADAAAARRIVDEYLADPQDPWHLRYYRERLETYYDLGVRPLALAVLDVLASEGAPLPFVELLNRVKTRIKLEDDETACKVLMLLQQDHYVLLQAGTARYSFRRPLIERYWWSSRGLGA